MSETHWLWNRLSGKYDRFAVREDQECGLVDRISAHLERDHDVLDFACATGLYAERLAPSVHSIFGVDTASKMIARARARDVPNARFECISLFDGRLETSTFDVALALNVLHLVRDPQAVVGRLRDLLRPRGRLVTLTPFREKGGAIMSGFFRALGATRLTPHVAIPKRDALEGWMSDFEIVETKTFGKRVRSCFCVAIRR